MNTSRPTRLATPGSRACARSREPTRLKPEWLGHYEIKPVTLETPYKALWDNASGAGRRDLVVGPRDVSTDGLYAPLIDSGAENGVSRFRFRRPARGSCRGRCRCRPLARPILEPSYYEQEHYPLLLAVPAGGGPGGSC